MATKRKGKKVNRSAYSRKKVPRKMRGNKRKSLKNKTSSRKRMNRKAGMDWFGGGAGYSADSHKEAEDTRQRVEDLLAMLNEQKQYLGEEMVSQTMEKVFRERPFKKIQSVEEMIWRWRENNDTRDVPRALKSILEETYDELDLLRTRLRMRPSTPPTPPRR